MSSLSRCARTFLRREDGLSAVEYSILLGLVVVVCTASAGCTRSSTSDAIGKYRNSALPHR